jgi:Patatin-like phospholipase
MKADESPLNEFVTPHLPINLQRSSAGKRKDSGASMPRPLQWLVGFLILALIGIGLWQNSVKWLFLCEVQWISAAFLVALPILAWTSERALLLGAYEIETWQQGFVLGLLLTLGAVSIFWTGRLELGLSGARLHEPIGDPFFGNVLGVLLLVAGVLSNLIVTHAASKPRGVHTWRATDWGMLFGVLAGIGCFIVVQAIVGKAVGFVLSTLLRDLIPLIQSCRNYLSPQFTDGYIGRGGNLVAESGHLGAVLLLVVSAIPYLILRKRTLSPLCSIVLLTIVLVWLLSGLAFFFQVFRIPTLIPLLVWLWLSSRHPKSDHFYEVGGNPRPNNPANIRFLESDNSEGRIIVVAASGGGIQAAAWTAKVLAELKTEFDKDGQGPFQNSLRAVSGVSGGSVGLMYYLACQASDTPVALAAKAAMESSLGEVTHAIAYDDLFRAFLPFCVKNVYRDRGKALVDAWVSNGLNAGGHNYEKMLKEATLNKWIKATAEGKLPAIILNSTIVEKGQRLAFSTVPTLSGSEGSIEFTTLYPQYDIPVSTATRLSAAFTFVSPAARPALPEREKELRRIFSAPPTRSQDSDDHGSDNLHLVDGGYLDNSGITALVSLLHEKTLELYGTAPRKLPKKILVLLINSFPAPPEQYVKPHRGTFFQMWAPLLTLLTVRGAAHDAMAQRELSLFRETLKNLNGIELSWIDFRFREAVRRSGDDEAAQEPPPLSWHLTKRQKSAIVNAWAQMRVETNQVRAFLNAGVMPP